MAGKKWFLPIQISLCRQFSKCLKDRAGAGNMWISVLQRDFQGVTLQINRLRLNLEGWLKYLVGLSYVVELLNLGLRVGLQGIHALCKLCAILCKVLHLNEDRGGSFPWISQGGPGPLKVKKSWSSCIVLRPGLRRQALKVASTWGVPSLGCVPKCDRK